ncbi:kinase-like domain-containing protein [Rhizophagus irregularis DAOM 181602=DAOM 197198]|nr:kinase-like domain-containing protein [Rhizophagus irregularis DAOM 181602=DAOM 197198]
MYQFGEEIRHRACVRCKKVDYSRSKFCETCLLKNHEEKNGICLECKQINTGNNWCKTCNSKRFQQNFDNWTSEWIPYDRFINPKYISEGGFGKVYRATWKDGYISHWDTRKNQWGRSNVNKFVALKSLNNSQNITLEFVNEITSHLKVHDIKSPDEVIKCYGISLDPKTKEYIMVMNYAKMGNLQNLLNDRSKRLHKSYQIAIKLDQDFDLNLQTWKYKLDILCGISSGLKKIHGQDYTQASDIYSLGIIIYEVISELPPYYNIAHDELLALNICEGLRPEFNIKVPQLILHLIKGCLDADPSNRPRTCKISRTFLAWAQEINRHAMSRKNHVMNIDNQAELTKTELIEQIEEVEKINRSSLNNSSLTNQMHPKAFYKSRSFDFKDLPEPKNSDDYYETYENISSKIYSGNTLKSENSDLELLRIDK